MESKVYSKSSFMERRSQEDLQEMPGKPPFFWEVSAPEIFPWAQEVS